MIPSEKKQVSTRRAEPREHKGCSHKENVKLDAREQAVYDALLPILHEYSHFSGDPFDFPLDSLEKDTRAAIVAALAEHQRRMVAEIVLDFEFGEDIDQDFKTFVQSLTIDDLEPIGTTWTDAVVESIVEGVKRALVSDNPAAKLRDMREDAKIRMWSIDSTTSVFVRVFTAVGRTIARLIRGRRQADQEKEDEILAAVWVSERDGKVCERCQKLDGEIVGKRGDTLISPGLHPYCRCRLSYTTMTDAEYLRKQTLTIGDIREIAGSLRGGY
jgi:hypothetical protein